MIVGLRSGDEGMKERQKKLGIVWCHQRKLPIIAQELEWLKNIGVSKVVVHFDLDVLEPA